MARPALTRSRIVSAGVSIVSELGLTALNFKAVARRVNATATGVQRCIGATELVESVVAQIVVSMPPVPTRGSWSRRLSLWALQTRAWLTEHPGLAGYLLANRWDTPAALDRLEEVIEVLDGTGSTAAQSVMTGITLYWFVLSSADLGESARVIGDESSKPKTDGSASSPGQWPRLSAHIGDYSTVAARAQFSFGLDLLIKGIEHSSSDGTVPLDARPAPRRTPASGR